MKFRFLLFTLIAFACKAKDTSENMDNNLKDAMRTYLYSTVDNDSSNVKYNVEKVIYFDDKIKDKYICEFTVHIKAKLFDTTGIMKANISKDLKKVDRIY